MEFPVSLIGGAVPGLRWPDLFGAAAWLLAFLLLAVLTRRLAGLETPWTGRRVGLAGLLVLAAGAVVLFTGARIPLPDPLVVPDELGRQAHVLFVGLLAVPLVLAAGFSGPTMAAVAGGAAGLALAFLSDRNPFTILQFGAIGLFLGACLRQPYRTPIFSLLRRPLAASLAAAVFFPLVFLPAVLIGHTGDLLLRLNFAFSLLIPESIAAGVSLLIAGVAGEAASRLLPETWGSGKPPVPSPAETSLETRSFQLMGAVIATAVLALSIVGWGAAYRSASGLVRSRMAGSAQLAADSLPNALETGQNLVQIYLADERLMDPDPGVAQAALEEKLGTGLYFVELMLVGSDGAVFARSAAQAAPSLPLSGAEASGIALASQGVPFQYYSGEAATGGAPSVISFIAPVPDSSRVLVGRSLLAENPFITPLLSSMQNLGDIDGHGILVDEAGLILHHPEPAMISTVYAGSIGSVDGFSTSTTPDGRPALVYSEPVDGRAWRVVVEVPVSAVQRLAFGIAAPFVALLAFLAVTSLGSLRLVLRVVTRSLRALADRAGQIAQTPAGIRTPIEAGGVDEVGRMQTAFERMRLSLNARMDEQERLLEASQGAAASLDFSQAVKPVLGAALTTGAESARLVLDPGSRPDFGPAEPRGYGAGPAANRFAYLDDQLLRLMAGEAFVASPNPVAIAGLSFGAGGQIPAALAAIPLRHDGGYLGTLWTAYTTRHNFPEHEKRFLSSLAAQASLAVANTRLFRSAQVGRERLAAILASTPDPILVTDHDHRLFLANLAAVHVLGERLAAGEGQPIDTLIDDAGLIDLFHSDPEVRGSMEVNPASGGCYVARLTAFTFRGQPFGKICILRDITRYKELDTVKDELVQNVGHDLEQPLQTIKGFATMLPLMGKLNEDQNGIIAKITSGADRMNQMLKNFVSLGKIGAGVGLEIVQLSLVDLVIRIVQEQHPKAIQKNVHVSLIPPGGPIPPIAGDETLLSRAVGNLVDNAIKYTNEGGNVAISFEAFPDRGVVRLAIEDDGIGIAVPDQERLGERFYRGTNPESLKRHGTGLGLSIVKSVIESHGGRVWVDSAPGLGSTFTVELPAIRVTADR